MCKGDLSRVRYVRSTVERENICSIYAASFASPPAHEEVISFCVLGQLAGNSTAARERAREREKRHANAIQIGTMLRTCEVRVSARERERYDLFIPPDSVPMRASFWHWARAFSSLFLPTTVRATSRWFYRDQLRQIHQDPQIRADRYVRHAEYRFIFTPDRRHPLGLQPPLVARD